GPEERRHAHRHGRSRLAGGLRDPRGGVRRPLLTRIAGNIYKEPPKPGAVGPAGRAFQTTSPASQGLALPPDAMRHVLVVDDDPDCAHGLAQVIGNEGLSVATAGSLGEARARMATRVPDMLLVDLKLPDGSGIELVQDASTGAVSSDVVLITGHA